LQYKVVATVKEILKPSGCDVLKVGDTFEVAGPRLRILKGDICTVAYNALFPFIYAMRFGGEGVMSRVCCPDPDGIAVFELKREPLPPSK